MNIEVHCSHCRTAYVVDDTFQGASMPCPSCGASGGLVVPHRATVASAAQEAPAPTPPVAQAPAPAVTPAAAMQPVAEAEKVVCPRCKLHFVPRKGKTDVPDTPRQVVLVVEAMDYFREIAAEALAGHFEVKQAASAIDARTILAAGGIDLLILDPEDDGIELLRAIGSKPCPILIYTDRDESDIYGETWDELRRYGADDIVMKGMNAGETLVRKVAGLLGVRLAEDD